MPIEKKDVCGTEARRDGGTERCRDGGMEGRRDGGTKRRTEGEEWSNGRTEGRRVGATERRGLNKEIEAETEPLQCLSQQKQKLNTAST